ncbi:hypothetical protein OKA05_20030 [Luteolibacter arcticus]|uniref:Lipoprotein n=1 Tax=Luteolibacter arcticus TaxID=1581411 RepID=A0ABT3GMW1_9BACT|nr:hypothetical protein [Luteolibacter arcticus]MCW1924862.1 hypothetical protein [Luteolibacter arcticus]
MKQLGFAGMVALALLSCERKEEATAEKGPAAPASAKESVAPVAKELEAPAPVPESKPTKASERPEVAEKKPPIAEPIPDKPGYVKSPFSGAIIDVKGIPGGTLVADPMFPSDQKKHFRIPKMDPEQEAIAKEELAKELDAAHAATQSLPEAKPVPGKPGFFFSPYDNKIIDSNGSDPGAVLQDPGAPEGTQRLFRIPGGKAPTEGE